MKKLLPVILLAVVVSACDVYVVEPRYDRRDSLTGYYDVEEYSETYDEFINYSIRISKIGSYDEIRIHNFYAADISVRAYVDYDKITIPYQVVDGYAIEGVGTMHFDDVHFSYSVKDLYQGAPTDFCQADFWRD